MKKKILTIALFAISLLACILSIVAICRPLISADKSQWREIYGFRDNSFYYHIYPDATTDNYPYKFYIRFEGDKVYLKTNYISGKSKIKEYLRTNITYVDYMTY